MGRAETAERLNCFESTWKPSRVIAFPTSLPIASAAKPHAKIYRFSMRDRMTAHDWAESVRCHGVRRVVFEAAGNFGDGESCEFMLIYQHSGSWASWGVGCDESGFMMWRTACGTTLGQFSSLRDALQAIEFKLASS